MTRLEQGNSVVIFPECELKHNEIVNDFLDKFVDTARFYHNKHGKILSFVPMYNAHKLKTIAFGKPIKYDPEMPIEAQRKVVCRY